MASLPWTGLSEVLVCARIDGQSALDRAFRSACMCKNKGILGSGKHHLRTHNVKEPWLQTQGTAMGTPLYYKRYIDNIFGIWIDNTTTLTNHNVDEPESPWVKFKETLNQFGSLKWNVEPLTHSTNYASHQLMKHTAKESKYSVYGAQHSTWPL
jgi:hypothetical protein